MKKNPFIFLVLFSISSICMGGTASLSSPDHRIRMDINYGLNLRYDLIVDGRKLMSDNHADLELDITESKIPSRPKVKEYQNQKEHISSPFYRVPNFDVEYNSCVIEYRKNLLIEFRAYNEGVAYRFLTKDMKSSSYLINGEHSEFNLTEDFKSYIPYSTNPRNPMSMAFQSTYDVNNLSSQDQSNLGYLPLVIDCGNSSTPELKLSLMESDVENYPGMFVKVLGQSICGVFSCYPKEFKYYDWRYQKYVTDRESYISRSIGDRSFPWRIIGVSYKDTDMPQSNLVYALASPNRIGDTSWIRPGKVAWDWWNDWGLTHVDFKAGINMDTYKYYIDFASRYGLEYVILDEGWYFPKSGDMLTPIEELDLPALVSYGESKGVKLILWTVFNVLDKDLEAACKKYSEMGIAGFKVDFLDRNDQEGVEMVYRIADACSRYKLLLDLHGIYPPTGLNRTYPNVLNFESVFGMEESKWTEPDTKDMPLNDVTFPYIRLQCGPVDFTPGGMRNATKKDYKPVYYNPMTMGTRCHQMAMYVIHDSPLTMLADSPSAYEQEPEYTRYLSSIPVVFDESRVLCGKMGEYIVTARRKGTTWYVGGQTNWNSLEIDLPMNFLAPASQYTSVMFSDGKNSNKNASDYRVCTEELTNSSVVHINMSEGGGFVIIAECK